MINDDIFVSSKIPTCILASIEISPDIIDENNIKLLNLLEDSINLKDDAKFWIESLKFSIASFLLFSSIMSGLSSSKGSINKQESKNDNIVIINEIIIGKYPLTVKRKPEIISESEFRTKYLEDPFAKIFAKIVLFLVVSGIDSFIKLKSATSFREKAKAQNTSAVIRWNKFLLKITIIIYIIDRKSVV